MVLNFEDLFMSKLLLYIRCLIGNQDNSIRTQLSRLPIKLRRSSRALTLLYSLLHSPNPPTYIKPQLEYL